MDPLTASGLGSGLDIKALVDQLVAAERQAPNDRINLAEARINRQVSSVGKLKGALADFHAKLETLTDLEKFLGRRTTVGNPDVLSISADTSSATGTYSIEVTSLAASQKVASETFVDAATAIGYGTLTLNVGGAIFEVDIDSAANTLADVRDGINAISTDTGVVAAIVTADDGARLVLTGAAGTEGAFSVTASGGDGGLSVFDYAVGTPGTYTEITAAADAALKIDGFDVTSSGNTITGAIEGVTLNLLDADPGVPFEISIVPDEASANVALTRFVSSYNALLDAIQSETAYDPEAGVSGALLGDSLTRRIQSTIRGAISGSADDTNATYRTLAEIGLTTTSTGKLELNDAKLQEVIAIDFEAVGQLFSEEGSVGSKLFDIVSTYVDTDGFIESREDRLQSQLEVLREARTRLDARMEAVRERFQRQFNAMDVLVAQLGTTSQFLAQQLG